MDWTRRALLATTAGSIAGLAGCLGTPGSTDGGTDATTTSTTVSDESLRSAAVECDPNLWVSFWGLGTGGYGWDRETVRIGYTVPADANLLFVAYVDGVPLGAKHVESDRAFTADGDAIDLERPLTGVHVVRVVAHREETGNGAFDGTADSPCLSEEGELVDDGPERIDFSAFGEGSAAGK